MASAPSKPKPAAAKPTIFQFRADYGRGVWRDVEIKGSATLADLAQIILDAYKFDLDHCYGFYSNLRSYSRSDELYELFEDLEAGSDSEAAKSVEKTKIATVFEPKKKLLFLFDYGDCWEFTVTCKAVVAPAAGAKYPRALGGQGDAPVQYPPLED